MICTQLLEGWFGFYSSHFIAEHTLYSVSMECLNTSTRLAIPVGCLWLEPVSMTTGHWRAVPLDHWAWAGSAFRPLLGGQKLSFLCVGISRNVLTSSSPLTIHSHLTRYSGGVQGGGEGLWGW